MSVAHLTIGKMPNDIYKIEFEAVHGKLVGRVSVRISGTDTRSDEAKKQAALGKFKALARALDQAISSRGLSFLARRHSLLAIGR